MVKLTWRLQKVSIYHIPPIWKDRPKFEDAFKSNVQNKKKLRCSHYDDIDKSLLGWFKEKRKQGIPISGPILQAKAKDFGTSGNGKF
jgi:O-glycosyl hydrolase